MDKTAPPIRRLIAGLALLAMPSPGHAAPTPAELLRDALAARAGGRDTEAVRLLTELKALTPGDKRVDSLLASLPPQEAAPTEAPPKSSPPGAAVSQPPSESPKAKPDSSPKSEIASASPLLSEKKPRPSGASSSEISNLKSEIPDKTALLQAALAAQAEGKPELALAHLRELQALSPDDPRLSSVVSALTAQGTATSQPTPGSPSEISNLKSEIPGPPGPYYSLPESLVLGVVTWVDPENKQAVVRLYGTWKPDRLYLLSRDASFEASAVLETSPFHNSRAIGVRAIEGMPQVGQEVVAPGPSVLNRIREILGPRYRGTPPPPVATSPDPAAPVDTAAPTGVGTVNPDLKPF